MNKIKHFYFSRKALAALLARDDINVKGQVLGILRNVKTGRIEVHHGVNIVTNEGDKYYAQRSCGETPTIDFAAGGARLGTGSTTPGKTDADVHTFLSGSGHAKKTGYPKTNDDDAQNTDPAVDTITWIFEYATSEGNGAGINEGAIVDNITTPTAALNHFLFDAPFNKTSSDTFKLIVNHNFLGV